MELQVFNNAEFGSVRSTMINDEPYFVGKDVATILGYAKPLNALATHVDEDGVFPKFCVKSRQL